MARRRSTGEYILSFLAGAIPSYFQSSQIKSAMSSKAALEAQKAKQKTQEKKQDNLFKIYSDINRDPDERQEAKNRYFVETGDILPTPKAKPEKVEIPKVEAKEEEKFDFPKWRASYIDKYGKDPVGSYPEKGKPKPKLGDPYAVVKKNLTDLVDEFNKALVKGDVFPKDYERLNTQYAPLAKILNDNGILVPENLGELFEEAEEKGEDPKNWIEKIIEGAKELIGGGEEEKTEKIKQRKGADGKIYEKRNGKWYLVE